MLLCHHKLDSALTVLLKYKNKDGPKMRQLPSIAAMTGINLDQETEDFKNFRRGVIHKLEESLLHRFSDMAADVLSACKIADFKSWPDKEEDRENFGETEVDVLSEKFQNILEKSGTDISALGPEWDILKTILYDRYKDVYGLDWTTVNKTCSDTCPNILSLIDLILSIPAHSADAERGFSEMKLVKSDWRSNLRSDVLSDLLFIQPAIALWSVSGEAAKRPNITPYRPREEDADGQVFITHPLLELDPEFLDKF